MCGPFVAKDCLKTQISKGTNNCYLSTNSLVDAIGTRSCYIKNRATKLDQTNPTTFSKFSTLTLSFLDLFMPHRRYWNCWTQNSALYNHIIKHVISWEAQAVMHIAHVCERLPRSQIQFRISRSFRLRNPANLGSEICFWIRLKEHCQHTLSDPRSTFFKMLNVINRMWRPVNGGLLCESGWKVGG